MRFSALKKKKVILYIWNKYHMCLISIKRKGEIKLALSPRHLCTWKSRGTTLAAVSELYWEAQARVPAWKLEPGANCRLEEVFSELLPGKGAGQSCPDFLAHRDSYSEMTTQSFYDSHEVDWSTQEGPGPGGRSHPNASTTRDPLRKNVLHTNTSLQVKQTTFPFQPTILSSSIFISFLKE